MKVVTAREMREIDRRTIEDYGIPGLVLMERAGLSVARRAEELFSPRRVIVLAGGGNNGGDGLVAARILKNSGLSVKVFFLARQDKASPDCKAQFKAARAFGVPISIIIPTGRPPQKTDFSHASLVVDAIFGTGLSKKIEGVAAGVIDSVNRSGLPVLAVDIPSGVSADTGMVLGTAIRATHTVTFGLPKLGHLLHPGAEHTGELFVEDIGFPQELLRSKSLLCEALEKQDISALLPERPARSSKGDYGHVLVVAGSKGKTGASLLAARAALRAGAGLVSLGVPQDLIDVFQARVTEEMTLPLASKDGMLVLEAKNRILTFAAERADSLAIGPGLGVNPEIRALIEELVKSCATPMVMDADAINALGANNTGVLKKAKAPVILTPHPGEMARLLKTTVSGVEKDRPGVASSLSKETGAYVVLKGVPTIIAEPEGRIFLNTTGSPAMAKAGSGDVLTGMMAGFLAQGLSPLHSALLAVYTHGLAGQGAARRLGLHSPLASDIIESIPEALSSLQG